MSWGKVESTSSHSEKDMFRENLNLKGDRGKVPLPFEEGWVGYFRIWNESESPEVIRGGTNMICFPRRNARTRLGDWVYSTRAKSCGKKKDFGTVIVLVAKRCKKSLNATQQNPAMVGVVNRPAG
jgi:hypothetical protein